MKNFSRFILKMFKIGCIGFGGGSALIPVIEQELIGTDKLDTRENYDKDILVANLTPGALPVELAASLGLRNFGYKGMLLGSLAMALPGVVATILLLTILSGLRQRATLIMELATLVVSVLIIALIVKYIRKVCAKSREFSTLFFKRSVAVMIGVFLLSCGKNLYRLLGITEKPLVCFSTLHILLLAFAGILAINFIRSLRSVTKTRNQKCLSKETHKSSAFARFRSMNLSRSIAQILGIWLLFLIVLSLPAFLLCIFGATQGNSISWTTSYLGFLGRGCASVLMSFGGGDAYLAVADGLFVESGMISSTAFYGDIVSVANILPGSILGKALTAAGYYYGISITGSSFGGLCFAAGGFAASIAVSCAVFGVIYVLYDHLSDFKSMKTIGNYIGPIISGLLGTVILALLIQCKDAVVTILSLL